MVTFITFYRARGLCKDQEQLRVLEPCHHFYRCVDSVMSGYYDHDGVALPAMTAFLTGRRAHCRALVGGVVPSCAVVGSVRPGPFLQRQGSPAPSVPQHHVPAPTVFFSCSVGSAVNAPAARAGDTGFESRLGHRRNVTRGDLEKGLL